MGNKVYPWWMGPLLLNPLRRLTQGPEKILSKYVKPNMHVMDIGCGMGYFSLPMAGLVGEQGKVICIDLQEKMIESLIRRARAKGLDNRIDSRICSENSLLVQDLEEKVDFVLAFAVVHEVPDQDRLFDEVSRVLKKGGSMLFAEPKGHVEEMKFNESIALAQKSGLSIVERPVISMSKAALLRKQ